MAGENGSYTHVNANTAGQSISPNSGAILRRVVINTVGTAGNTLTIFDGTSTAGKTVAVANTTNAAVPSLDYNCVMAVGIFITLATGTAADLTFIYQ